MALKSDAAAEKAKDRLSREGCSIFEFCNNIGQKRSSTQAIDNVGFSDALRKPPPEWSGSLRFINAGKESKTKSPTV